VGWLYGRGRDWWGCAVVEDKLLGERENVWRECYYLIILTQLSTASTPHRALSSAILTREGGLYSDVRVRARADWVSSISKERSSENQQIYQLPVR
jgi:hypothetical protein